jgi:5-methylcytosine-specific restriction endonuclease McrA
MMIKRTIHQENYIMTDNPQKRCTKCGETKPIEMFSRNKHGKDGLQSRCKKCCSEYHAGYRATHVESIRKQKRAWEQANPDKVNAAQQAWRDANREKYGARLRAWREANPDRDRQLKRKWYDANTDLAKARERIRYSKNIDEIREKSRAYQRANPEVSRAARQRHRARLKGNGGSFTTAELSALRQAQAGRCAYCGQTHNPDELTIDHIIPVSQGGRNDITNICLACLSCNSSKSDRTPEEWVNRWYNRKK